MPLHLGTNPLTGDPVRLPEDALLRHVVILGATGSGKTVLGKAILEEAARAGVPCIAVDAQGDLASLALAPTQESASRHPAPPEAVDGYWSRASVAIFTPGSGRGTPLGLNPLRAPPPFATDEDAVVYLDALAESLAAGLGYDTRADLGGRAKDVVYLVLHDAWARGRWPGDVPALAALLEKGGPAQAETILTKRERAALVRRAKSMTVGAKGLLYTAGPALDVDAMLAWAPPGRTPLNVVYMGGLRNPAERDLVVATLCKEVYRWMTAGPSGDLRLLVYIDEVAGLCPPHPRNPPAKRFLTLLFRQARKYGVGLVVATQNVTDLDYKALGQVNTWALGRLLAKQDLDRVRHLVSALHPAGSEAVLAAVPSLRTGQFVLLSPDHIDGALRLEVRGLASQHVVVPEERFREVQSTHALAGVAVPEGPVERRRTRLATTAAKAARMEIRADVEEGIGLRVLRIFEDLPGLFGPADIVGMTGTDERFIGILLRKMAEARLLRAEHLEGRDVYWDPTVGFDPRRGAPAKAAFLPLRVPLVEATRQAKDHLRRRILVLRDERLARKDFYYVPLWRVEAEMALGRGRGRLGKTFFVNAVTGELAHTTGGRLTFEELPRKDARRLEPLAPKGLLDSGPTAKVGDPVVRGKVGPGQAQEIVRKSFGAKPVAEPPELVLLPVWRFDLESRSERKTRPLWIDGTFGTALRSPPEGL